MSWVNEPIWDRNGEVAGGVLLRTLRQSAGMSLMELAGRLEDRDIHIDTAHLQRIESGRIARPKVDTLKAILTVGLDAPYRIRRDVLEAFGYRLPWVLPTEEDVADGHRLCRQDLRTATWPVYFMDYGQRVWAWNRYIPRLLGLLPDDPALSRFVGLTPLDLAFNPAVGTNLLIANAGAFLPQMLQMFKLQTQPHAHEPWFLELLDRARAWPGFEEIWSCLSDDSEEALATQPIVPIQVRVPGIAEPMRFRLALFYLTLDPRFQMLHWIPYGAATLRQNAEWAEEDGEW